MAMVPPDPYAGRPRGPRIVPVGARPNGDLPGGGLTLDALMQRQKTLATNQPQMTEMTSPWQGVAYAANQLAQGLQEGRAEREAKEGRSALAQAMTQFDPNTGEFSPEAIATMGALDPEHAFAALHDMAASRQRRSELEQSHKWDVEGREDTQKSAAELAAQSQGATADQNLLQRQADDARQRAQDAAAAGRQDDAQQARLEEQKAQAGLDKIKADEDAKRGVAKIGQEGQARSAEADRLGLKPGTPERLRFEAEGKLPQETDQWTPIPAEVAKAQGGDVARNPSAYRYNSKTGAVEPLEKAVSPSDVKATQDIKGKLIETRGQINTLNRAMELADRVFEGPTAKQRADAVVASNGFGVSPETLQQAKDTQEFFRIMDLNAVTQMAQTLSGSDSDRDVARFMQILSDPRTSAQQKQAQIQALIDKGRAYEQIQAEGVRQTGGDPDKLTIGGGSDGSGASTGPQEGATATGPNGEKVILRNGKWVPV